MTAALRADKLQKTFRKPFTGTRVEAVKGVSFVVETGEVFGYIGPNGAGKTTSIKMIVGLIFPTTGTASIFGTPAPSPEAMRRVGFLPENPYIYPYLTPREFVSMCGRLSGIASSELSRKVERVIDRVGMTEAIDRPVRALSKGMTQRVGLASALVHDPDLLILDEPMSGLDPVGRKDVRDLILDERARGKTVFFSTHILSDVETLCDRVCILRKGEVALTGKLDELLAQTGRVVEIAIDAVDDELRKKLAARGWKGKTMGGHFVLEVSAGTDVRDVIDTAYAGKATIVSVTPKRETLEKIFSRTL
jgi:ABC-2 type transport system ATP-binding protein